MNMNILKLIILCSVILTANSCTENSRAKNYGGTMEINLPRNQMLINATWKNDELWYLYEEMPSDYKPKKKIFKEKSSFGKWEGTIIFTEYK